MHRVRSRTALAMLWWLAISSHAVYLHLFISCTTTFLCCFLLFRLDGFGLSLGRAQVVFRVLLDGLNPQDVATSLGGVGLISNRQLNLDAGTHFNYWTWKIGEANVEGLDYFLGG